MNGARKRRVAANKRIFNGNIIQTGAQADDAIAHNGTGDMGIVANAHIRTYDGIFDVCGRRNVHGRHNDIAFIAPHFIVVLHTGFEQLLIGLQDDIALSAIEPIGYWKGFHADAFFNHAIQRIGKIEFVPVADIVGNIVFQAFKKRGRFPNEIKSHQGQIRMGDIGFFYEFTDASVVFEFGYAK